MKNLIKKSGFAILNIVLIIGFTLLFVNKMENENIVEAAENDNIEIELFYMYKNDIGLYFIDPKAEFENVIFVEYDEMKEWNVSTDLHHGERFIGTFDNDGWELFGMKKTDVDNFVPAKNENIAECDELELEIFFMYENEDGGYFLEPNAEFENVIFIEKQDMKNMHMGENIHHGTKFIGVFDSTGWELLGISDLRF